MKDTEYTFRSKFDVRFKKPSIEEAYLKDHLQIDLALTRFGLLVSAILYAIYYHLMLPLQLANVQDDFLIIYITVLLTVGLFGAYTYSQNYRTDTCYVHFLPPIVAGWSVLWALTITPSLNTELTFLTSLPLAGYFLLFGLQWLHALIIASLYFMSTIILLNYLKIPVHEYSLGIFSLLGTFIITALAGNRIEYYTRKAFIETMKNTELINGLKKNEASLHKLSITDSLTNLFNRRHFDDVGPLKIQDVKRLKSNLHLLTLDIDHFKLYNDHYGHPAGDDVLKAIAVVLKKTLKRSTDQAFRIGGEEFAILMLGGSDTVLKNKLNSPVVDN